jgi:hypothetical protein
MTDRGGGDTNRAGAALICERTFKSHGYENGGVIDPDALFNPQEALRGVEYTRVEDEKNGLGPGTAEKPFPHNPQRLARLREFSDVFGSYAWGMLNNRSLEGDWRSLEVRMSIYERPKVIIKQANLFEWKVGEGRLLVSTLNLELPDPATAYLLDRIRPGKRLRAAECHRDNSHIGAVCKATSHRTETLVSRRRENSKLCMRPRVEEEMGQLTLAES